MGKQVLLRRICAGLVVASGCALLQVCHAAPDEIVVFTDEFEMPGAIGYELHVSFAARARKTPDYSGEQPPNCITESRYNAEVRGIFGVRQGDWKFTVNPILNQALSPNPNGRPIEIEVFAQVLRSLNPDFSVGVEHFASLGRLSNPNFGSQSGQISYLVMDIQAKKHLGIHLGLGQGWTRATDKRVLKALISLPF
jgi:hypothetical protein